MTTNTKPKSAIPNATDQLRERRERASREVLNEIGAATSRAADVMTCCCSNSIRLTPKSWQTRSLLTIRRSFNGPCTPSFCEAVEQTKQLAALRSAGVAFSRRASQNGFGKGRSLCLRLKIQRSFLRVDAALMPKAARAAPVLPEPPSETMAQSAGRFPTSAPCRFGQRHRGQGRVPSHGRMRAFGRDLIREGHGQRSWLTA